MGREVMAMSFAQMQARAEEADLHDWIEWFCRTYAPEAPELRARWEADLAILVHRICHAAQAPLIKQMSAALSLQTQTIFMKKESK